MRGPEALRFFFDYVDPASFVLQQRLKERGAWEDFVMVLEPFEIRPPPQTLLDPEDPEWRSHFEFMEAKVQERGHQLARPWLVPWTRKAHELAQHALEHGCFPEVHDALFQAYLFEGRDIGRVDVLVELAARVGMDPMEAKAVLDVDRYRETVERKREWGLALGVSRVPTLAFMGRTLRGLPDEEELGSFLTPSKAGSET